MKHRISTSRVGGRAFSCQAALQSEQEADNLQLDCLAFSCAAPGSCSRSFSAALLNNRVGRNIKPDLLPFESLSFILLQVFRFLTPPVCEEPGPVWDLDPSLDEDSHTSGFIDLTYHRVIAVLDTRLCPVCPPMMKILLCGSSSGWRVREQMVSHLYSLSKPSETNLIYHIMT